MHELMITESILEIALRHAGQAGNVRVTDLYLVIGELSSVIDDSVQFYWDFVSEGTAAEGAELHFKRIPAKMTCRDCGSSFSPRESLICTGCSGNNLQIVAGQEFFLESIEISQKPIAPGMPETTADRSGAAS